MMLNNNTKIAIATFFILLISSIIGLVSYAVTAEENIIDNSERILDFKINNEKIIESINNHENRLTTMEVHYEHISASLDRIETKINQVK